MLDLKNDIGELLNPENRRHLEADILPGYLKRRRWFASKDQHINAIQLVHAAVAAFPTGEVLFCDIDVSLTDRIERYQLPLGFGVPGNDTSPLVDSLKLADVNLAGKHHILTDAFSLDTLATGLLQAVKANESFDLLDATMRCSRLSGFEDAVPIDGFEVRRISAEQSNSSLVIDDQIIVKLVRRVRYGINPEVEMVRYLTANRYAHTPPLLGEIEKVLHDGSTFSMYIIQKFIPNIGDAWEYTLEFLRTNPLDIYEYTAFASAIGRRLGELHEVLARPTSDEAFAPLEADDNEISLWARTAQSQLRDAFQALEKCENLSGSIRRNKDFVIAKREPLLSAVTDLARSGLGSPVTRIHGDFHLGQILVSDKDAYIIDFEGEPAKSLEVRRSKSSPMRDVAGLVRSLDYAAGVAKLPAQDFAVEMSLVFLKAYQNVINNTPYQKNKGDDQQASLLNLFLLEKCAYEICYEVANRPEWIGIPLQGLVNLSVRILNSPESSYA
jgi:maltose alpha-D-glucosyltransferase/alpha-amylase